MKPEHIREKSDFLLKNMAFFFIPAGVALMESFGILVRNLLPFLAVCLISTVVTFGATAGAVRGAAWLQNRLRKQKEAPPRD